MTSRNRALAVVGAAAILTAGVSTAATAAGDIGWRDFNDSLQSKLVFRGYMARQIHKSQTEQNNAIADTYASKEELGGKADKGDSYTKEESDDRYAKKSDIPVPGEPGSKVDLTQHQSQPTKIEKIGGRFAENATTVDTFTLPAGTYQITGNGFFGSTEATSGQTRLQLALRTPPAEGEQWGKDVGTCFTGAASALANREITCSTTRIIKLEQPTEISVKAFGYADDQGSADSGKFAVQTTVDVLSVG